MDVGRQDLFFWRLVEQLVKQYGMRIIEMNSKQQEVWLEDRRLGKNQTIRLVRANFDWANHLRHLLDHGAVKFETLRKRFLWRKMSGLQVVVMNLPTVDSYDEIVSRTLFVGKKRKTMTKALVIETDKQQKEASLRHLFQLLELQQRQETSHLLAEEEVDILFESRRIQNELATIERDRLEQEKALFTHGKRRFTYMILFIQAIVFLLLEFNGGSSNTLTLIEYGAKYNPLIEEGQWWRFMTAIFLHIGFLHLFFNSFAVYVIGTAVEGIYGSWRFLVIYFTAGLFGALASFAFTEQISAGASGAIFGLFGALLYFGLIHRTLFFRTIGMSVLFILLVNLMLGFFLPMIDDHAHLGGLVGGFLAALVVHLPNHRQSKRQIGYLFLTAAAFVGLFLFGMHYENKEGSSAIHYRVIYELIEQEEYEKAKQILVKKIDDDNEDAQMYFWLSFVEIHLDNMKEAKTLLLKAISLDEQLHEAHYNLALVHAQLAEYDLALQSVKRAIEIAPNEEQYVQTKEDFEQKFFQR